MSKILNRRRVLNFEFRILNLFRVSNFGFRVSRTGYTLIEMVLATGIFAIIVVVAIGAVISIGDAHLKASNIQNIQDNLRFALEHMTREMRTGRNFSPSVPPSGFGCPPLCTEIAFDAIRGGGGIERVERVGYCLDAATGEMRKFFPSASSCATGIPLTDQSIVIDQLLFYVVGHQSDASDGQARISALLRATSRNPDLATTFRLQTTVARRDRDQ